MSTAQNEFELIKNALRSAPKGMSIIDLSEALQISRNSMAKYLEMLSVAGDVQMRLFGRSKIYRLSGRVSLATALSLSSELIAFVDEGLVVIDVNEPFLQYTSLKRDDIVGRSLEEVDVDILVHPGVMLYVKDSLNGREYVREIDVRRGVENHYFKAKLIPVKAGDQRRVALVYENTTSMKKAELAMKASEARYRAVVEDQTDIICRLLPDSTITFANDAMCQILQVPREAIVGKLLVDLIPARYRAMFRQDFAGVRIDQPVYYVENRIVKPDGQDCWMHWTYRGIFDRGRLAEVQFIARDITERKRAELKLQESEGRYRAMVEGNEVMIARLLPDSTITFLNEACNFQSGSNIEDSLGKKYLDMLPPDLRELVAGKLEQVRSHRCRSVTEVSAVTVNGKQRWLRWTCRGIFDERDDLREYQITALDITDLKRTEAALRESEANLQNLYDNAPIGICKVSVDLRFLGVNPEMCRITGYTDGELLDMTVIDITHPDDRQRDTDMALAGISSPEEYHRIEKRFVHRDGHEIWMRVNGRLMRDDTGRPIYFVSMFEDITDRKQTKPS